jgi:RNase H-fold protein (predicted Holliday junction resolvase)
VIGLPTNFSGQDTEVTTQIRNFARKFQQDFPHLKIHFVNERGSSKIAKNQLNILKYLLL